ncbi:MULTISPECIES: hypothetical protein [unclassified Mesorhizobium]|uniref:hypothetical protein n=1 Tax=unclassified Mesorhizobium TaxID=325217 RepID=UPI000FDC17E8|nr:MULTISPECIES: hypothetical protein [unclassified Mesorhizobium]TGT76149.1 hypothetical protein EN809_000550 [Mesorhizobium sp. M2E.F.Ca.ET.166.01.1.1]TGW02264.1 hypothetical protein EN797_000550 [Mesorhizobium sp. M2E.F.Ca.ET.154.01.1.1]
MSSLGYITQVLAADVANNGTVAVSYPSGQTKASLAGSSSGDLTLNDGAAGILNEGASNFSLAYGASTITVTNLSGYTWSAGTTLKLSFGENAPRGSYEANVNGAGGAALADGGVVSLTASAAVAPGTRTIELNHASVVIAATLKVVPNTTLIIKNNSASGTAAHTVTLSGGTFDGTTTVATLNAPNKALAVYFDSAGNGSILANVGTVTLA